MFLRTARIMNAPLTTRVLVMLLVVASATAAAQDDVGFQNQLPAIAGSPPPSILQGDVFGFSPVASDADGDTLTFWIENKPAWASFQTTTGVLYGVPASEDVGLYTGIQIWVTDDEAWAALPAFDIDVLSADLPSVRLSWEPPTTNSDGSMLSNLSGYRIHIFSLGSPEVQSVDVADPRLTSYLLGNLGPDLLYFSITAINSAGMESGYSNFAIHDLR